MTRRRVPQRQWQGIRGYAAVAAALYQSAALFPFQTGDPGDALPVGNVPILSGIQGIPPLNAV